MQDTRTTSEIVLDRKGAFAMFAAILLFVLSLAAYAGLFFINKSQEDAQAQLVIQIQQKEDDLRPKLLDQIFVLEKKLQSVGAVIGAHQFTANTFTALERDTHPRVIFDSYSFVPKDRNIELKGEADDFAVLGRQIAFLQGDQQINNVEFGGLALTDKGRIKFNLTLHLLPSLTATRQ